MLLEGEAWGTGSEVGAASALVGRREWTDEEDCATAGIGYR
jgi:hypothetical protein